MLLGRKPTGNLQKPNIGTWNISKQNEKRGEKRGHNSSNHSGSTPDSKGQKSTSQIIQQMTPQKLFDNSSKQALILSPVKPKNIKNIENNFQKNLILPRSPQKENIKVLTLKDLIFNLIKGSGSRLINGEKTFNKINNVNTLLNNYESPKANIQQILSTPFKLSLPELITLNRTVKGSGAHSTIYSLKNKGIVYKKFKKTGIKKYLLPELYGGLINAKIQESLSPEEERYINKILQMYAYTYMDNGISKNTLIVYLEESEGDLVTFTERYRQLNINQACNFFHKLCHDTLNMLRILKREEIVHRDIKPDNILYKIKNREFNLELADFSTCIDEGTLVDACIGTDAYIGNKFAARFYTSTNRKAKIGYSSDLFAMGLTLFNMYVVSVYKKSVKFYNDLTHNYTEVSQYFPFTNDESTIESKIENWSDRVKYNNQVSLLKNFLENSLNDILGRPGLTNLERDNLIRDGQMIETLLLSNDPFVDSIDFTYQEIERYLTRV
jgi:hypothetical protein